MSGIPREKYEMFKQKYDVLITSCRKDVLEYIKSYEFGTRDMENNYNYLNHFLDNLSKQIELFNQTQTENIRYIKDKLLKLRNIIPIVLTTEEQVLFNIINNTYDRSEFDVYYKKLYTRFANLWLEENFPIEIVIAIDDNENKNKKVGRYKSKIFNEISSFADNNGSMDDSCEKMYSKKFIKK